MGEVHVADLVAAADVVDLAAGAALDEQIDRPAVVHHVQPVAHVEAIAVQRQGPLVDGVGDKQRDDLLGELVRPVVVRGARDDDRDVVGRKVAVRQPIGGGLAGRVRVARLDLVALAAGAFRHAAVDLVGRDLDEPPQVRRGPGGLEQHVRADDVGLEEISRRGDGPVHVRLGGKVHHDVRPLHERCRHHVIGDVAADEGVARVVHDVGQRLDPAGIGELVERRDAPVRDAPPARGGRNCCR